jgi:hypothetical protein
MAESLDLGEIQVSYRLMDIREIEAEVLMASGRPADYALGLLARGGVDKMREILEATSHLEAGERQRALTQTAILSGLRSVSGQLTMELKRMGNTIDIEKHEFLKELRDSAMAAGRAEGRAEGKAEGTVAGMAAIVRGQIEARFGELPKWARTRLGEATAAELERWAKGILRASTLESVFGKK